MKRDAQPKLSFDLFADIDAELKVNAPKKTIQIGDDKEYADRICEA